jgi:xanthine/uracil permease
MKVINWPNVLGTIATLIGVALITVLFNTICREHHVERYYLTQHTNVLVIKADIDWMEDEKILLDRNISYDSAVALTIKLNQSLTKNK